MRGEPHEHHHLYEPTQWPKHPVAVITSWAKSRCAKHMEAATRHVETGSQRLPALAQATFATLQRSSLASDLPYRLGVAKTKDPTRRLMGWGDRGCSSAVHTTSGHIRGCTWAVQCHATSTAFHKFHRQLADARRTHPNPGTVHVRLPNLYNKCDCNCQNILNCFASTSKQNSLKITSTMDFPTNFDVAISCTAHSSRSWW